MPKCNAVQTGNLDLALELCPFGCGDPLWIDPAKDPILQKAIRGEDTKRNLKHVKDRVSGLKLLVAAIILWNTTYLQRAVDHLRNQGYHPASGDMAHLSPLGWEHINLTGDYHWDTSPTLRSR
jgi:hypothetical protein